MDKKLTAKLFEKYDFLRPEQSSSDIAKGEFIYDLMVFGIETDNGWYELIDELCGKIQGYLEKHPDVRFKASQVKEKWGGLRFYFTGGNKELWKMVNEAEKKSYRICECCGAKGRLLTTSFKVIYENGKFFEVETDEGWCKTLCDKDAKKLKYFIGRVPISKKMAKKILNKQKSVLESYSAYGDYSQKEVKEIERLLKLT